MSYYLWLDLEMTGLNVEENVIIETAAILTNENFQPIQDYHSVVFQPASELAKMDDWNTKHHTESGLISLIPNGKKIEQAEAEILAIIKKHLPIGEMPILSGNSIWQDRVFLTKYMPTLTAYLHYRMLDVSSWKLMMKDRFKIEYKKKGTHRATDDILESIAELEHYLSLVKP